jgi:hypothetical protein
MTDHDLLLDGIQRYEPYEKFGCGGHSEGDFVLFSDLPALIARVREDERGKIVCALRNEYHACLRREREEPKAAHLWKFGGAQTLVCIELLDALAARQAPEPLGEEASDD